MKLSIKAMSLILVFAMLISFAACKTGNGDESSVPSADETTSEETTSEEISVPTEEELAQAAYKSAAEALAAKKDVKQSIKASTVRKVGTDVFEYEQERNVIFKGLGTDDVKFHVSDKNTCGSTLWKTDKYFADGKYIHSDNDTNTIYFKEKEADDAVDEQVPVALFDIELYDKLSFKDGDESVLVLSDAIAVEKWLAPDYAKLTDLTAEIKLDDKGEIQSYTYTVDYTQGPADYEVSYEVSLSAPTAEDEIKVPEDEGVEFEGAELVDVMKLANMATKKLISYEYASNIEIYSQAGGVVYGQNEQIYFHGTEEKDFIGKTVCDFEMYQVGGKTQSVSMEQKYKDGKLVTVMDGRESTQSYSMKQILDSVIEKDEDIGLLAPDVSMFETCEVNDLTEFWHISYTLNEKGSQFYEDYINVYFFRDENVFGDYLTEYKGEKGEGFISIDRDTLLITSVGMDYEGTSTIEGDDYTSGFFNYVSYGPSTVDTYKEITGELPEETEPEEKPTPLFYKVTAPDGTVMYLLGTIHLGDSRTAYLPQEIYDAFEASDALAVEFDLIEFEESLEKDENLMELLSKSYYYVDGTTIKEHLDDEELYKAGLQHVLTAGTPPIYADYMNPSTWGDVISSFYRDYNFGLSSEYGVDYRLLRMAKDKNMEILNVESAELQYGMTEQYTESIHKMLLYSSLFSTRHETIEGLDELFELWCEGDEAKLKEYLSDEESDEEIEEDIEDKELAEEMKEAVKQYNAILGADRDEGMVEKAKEYMESGKTVFFAVGLAHIISETGLVDSLKAEGYTVERVSFSEEAVDLNA